MSDAPAAGGPARAAAATGLTLDDVARLAGGRVVARAGDPRVRRVATLEEADADAVSFYADARYADAFAATRAGAVLVASALADAVGPPDAGRVVVERPHEAMRALIAALYPAPSWSPGVHPTARVGVGARLGAGVTIDAYATVGAGAVIGDRVCVGAHCAIGDGVEVGAASELRPHVTLYPGTIVGARVVVHSGARLGSDGFGYVFSDGAHQKIPHVGRCLVEDDVEIGANSTIDRGSVGDTVIGAGTKIDNLVHVGHNVRVGRRCLLMAQVGIAGSSTVEDGAILAGQVGVGGHVTIGRGARLAGQAGVFGDVPPGETWGGYPARPHRESLRAHAALFRLADLVRPLERLVASREGGRR
ncbi:UDP-3-O-acylglucosamine N-acyltransferase [Gemmatimonadetes bacterium T265]|nr:UDP-3-O-acylglucosamine N-acyltransferase [Gemmatimonadetes bacterium T265]